MFVCLECNVQDIEKTTKDGVVVYSCDNCKNVINSNKKKYTNQAINQETHLKNILKRTSSNTSTDQHIEIIKHIIRRNIASKYRTEEELEQRVGNNHYVFNYIVSNLNNVFIHENKKINSSLITSILIKIATSSVYNIVDIKERILILFNEYQIYFSRREDVNKNNISYLEFIIIALSIIMNRPLPLSVDAVLRNNSNEFKQYIISKYDNFQFNDTDEVSVTYSVPNMYANETCWLN